MQRIPEGQTPKEVAELIRDIITDKVVCDIGCGGGSFMTELSYYAKEVIGVEEERVWAERAADRGFTIVAENAFSFPLPNADVYYCWSQDAMGIYMKAKFEGTKGIFIFGHTVRKPLLSFIKTLSPEVRVFTDKAGDEFKVYICNL